MDQKVVIAVVLCAMIFGGYFFLEWLKKYKRVKVNQEPKTGNIKGTNDPIVNVVVYDDHSLPPRRIKTTMRFKDVKDIIKENGGIGRVYQRDNKRCYYLHRKPDLELEVLPQRLGRAKTPRQFYNALLLPDGSILWEDMIRDETPFLQKYGQVLWWVAVMAFIMLLWASQ